MLVLGIESSCDDTSISVVSHEQSGSENLYRSLSCITSSQTSFHQRFGGVVPEIASRAHLQVIDQLAKDALSEAGVRLADIDAIAVTQGPGLVGSLLIGASFAKGLALAVNKPLVPINHIHAHIYGALIDQKYSWDRPTLAFVVSGGHSNLYYMQHSLDFNLIGYSIDDACGECFDKVAKMLGHGYPGGPILEKLAQSGKDLFPMPKISVSGTSDSIRLSYSGLKTHIAQTVKKIERENSMDVQQAHCDLAHSFQKEALGQIVRSLEKAIDRYPQVDQVIIAGGVSANQFLRNQLQRLGKTLLSPNLAYCSDNGAMIAALGAATLNAQRSYSDSWDVFSRYSFNVTADQSASMD